MQSIIIAVLSESGIRLISAHHKPEHDNYEVENAIEAFQIEFVRQCGIKCLSNKLGLSYFYNLLYRNVYFTHRSVHLYRDVIIRERVKILRFPGT